MLQCIILHAKSCYGTYKLYHPRYGCKFKGMGNQTSNIKKVHIRTSTCIYNLSLKNHAKFKLNLCYKEEMYARADTAKLK